MTLLAWSLLFAMGLVPELAFNAFRDAAGVSSFTAVVNSSAIITIGFAAYLGLFVYRRCEDDGRGPVECQGRALQVAIIALVAFLDLPAKGYAFESRTLLELALQFRALDDAYLQSVVLGVGLCKLGAWCYLFALLLRYHAFGNRAVFSRMPSMFMSVRRQQRPKTRRVLRSKHTPVMKLSVTAEELDDSTRRN